jgi:hypothetical protein
VVIHNAYPVIREELFDNGLQLATDTVVNVWRGSWTWCSKPAEGSTAVQNNNTCGLSIGANAMKVRDKSWRAVMGKATAAGYKTVLSSPYYLNVINQGSNFNEDWCVRLDSFLQVPMRRPVGTSH